MSNNDQLHPVDWVEPTTPIQIGGRSKEEALKLIREAVPAGGDSMTIGELTILIHGGYVRRSVLAKVRAYRRSHGSLDGCPLIVSVDDDAVAAVSAIKAKLPVVIKGPNKCRRMKRRRIHRIIREVIAERSDGWTYLDDE